MTVSRDFEANPYTPHEERVAKYLNEVAGIGGGDDPIEFLIASHAMIRQEVQRLKKVSEEDELNIGDLVLALEEIYQIVHVPTRDTKHKHANDHYGADFDKIRKIIERVLDD